MQGGVEETTMAAETVLEVPPELHAHNFAQSIVCIEHRADPTIYYGNKVPVVTLRPGAEKLGVFLGCKRLYGNLFKFKLLFQGVLCWGEEDAIRNFNIPIRAIREDGLVACGAGRVYISPELVAPLPPLR